MPRRLKVLPVLFLLLGACTGALEPQDAYARSRAQWRALGIVSYDFTLHSAANEVGESTILYEVRNGVATAARDAATGAARLSRSTIDDIFDTIDNTLRHGRVYELEFDPGFGYPMKVSGFHRSPASVDDGFSYEVVAFTQR